MFFRNKSLYLFYVITGLSVLTIVWVLQYGFGFLPCPLCYYQRYPWWLLVMLGLFGWLLSSFYQEKDNERDNYRGFLLILGMAVMIFSATLAAYHAGIEWKFWAGPSTCSAINMTDPTAQGIDDFFNAAKVVRCDQAALVVAGLSLSGWNFVISFFMLAYLSFLLFAKKR